MMEFTVKSLKILRLFVILSAVECSPLLEGVLSSPPVQAPREMAPMQSVPPAVPLTPERLPPPPPPSPPALQTTGPEPEHTLPRTEPNNNQAEARTFSNQNQTEEERKESSPGEWSRSITHHRDHNELNPSGRNSKPGHKIVPKPTTKKPKKKKVTTPAPIDSNESAEVPIAPVKLSDSVEKLRVKANLIKAKANGRSISKPANVGGEQDKDKEGPLDELELEDEDYEDELESDSEEKSINSQLKKILRTLDDLFAEQRKSYKLLKKLAKKKKQRL